EDALSLVFRQARPSLCAQNARQTRDDQIRPQVALPFADDFGDRDTKPSAQLRQRGALRDELRAMYRRKNLQDERTVEADDKIGAGGEHVRRRARQAMAARNIERYRQPL